MDVTAGKLSLLSVNPLNALPHLLYSYCMTDEASKPITSPKDILVLAFRALNDPDPDAKASGCEEQLASQLNVHTVLDLVESLGINDDQKLVETRALLKDKLVKALRGVIEELKKDGRLAASINLPPPSKTRRTLSISRVDWQQLSKISQKDMSFDIELFVQAAFVDGAKDPDLRAASDKFPVDVLGRPTFRPSANWFLSQVDFTTLAKFPMHTRMSSVVTAGNDLQLNKKIAGSFYEDFDGLWAFPFDMQILTVNLVFTVANEGATPIDLAFAEKVDTSVVDQASFADKNAWHIANELHLELTSVVASSGRTYPAMAISVRVYRRPFFFLINVAMPTGLFALLGIAIMSLPVNYPPARLTYMLTLMLTLVAYKLSMSSSMPSITYLTSIDKYQLGMSGIILAITFETTVCALWQSPDAMEPMAEAVVLADTISQIVFGVLWLLGNSWWGTRMFVEHMKRREVHLQALRSEKKKAERAEKAKISTKTFSKRSTARGSIFVDNSRRSRDLGSGHANGVRERVAPNPLSRQSRPND